MNSEGYRAGSGSTRKARKLAESTFTIKSGGEVLWLLAWKTESGTNSTDGGALEISIANFVANFYAVSSSPAKMPSLALQYAAIARSPNRTSRCFVHPTRLHRSLCIVISYLFYRPR
jgi:hypothetical protein